ncbi:MAG: UDP-N-acetylglucosamine 4,6-dehydratase (inverting) [Deltaproteobacteria bacterium]|nr:UDP-N-acetylglucosamine 4,6-dehydratase (inverting) [Deltaproteobacteria bacterium]
MLSNRTILITGGTGSFGRAFVRIVLDRFPEVQRIVVYSRDELKQSEMQETFSDYSNKLRFFLGNVRDLSRLTRAMEGIDIVVHAAALKQIPATEYNPFEAVKTNVLGAQNVIDAAVQQSVSRVVALSTDKAAAPINLYGATKLCSDKLFVSANTFIGCRDLRFSVVRYGNVMGSRGSVIPFFLKRRSEKVLPITHPRMTRFNITLKAGVEMVLHALEKMWGGEIYVPRLPSYRVCDLAEAIGPHCEQRIVGLRPGEKIHEEMITASDSFYTIETEDAYVILPSMPVWDVERFISENTGKRCAEGFCYNSETNDEWLDVPMIRRLIREYVDPTFDLE